MILLLAALFCSAQVVNAQTAGSSVLDEPNRAAPDYVTRYAPLVWLHSEDPFRPADLLEHIRHTAPAVDNKPIHGLPELGLDNLAILNDIDGEVALTAIDNITTLPAWLFGEAPDDTGRTRNATSCVVILVEKGSVDIDVFYFYFYSYDRGPNLTQVVEPLNLLLKDDGDGMHFGNHVGDWEHNMIRFHHGKPVGIFYSQHRDGAEYNWNDTSLSMNGQRPIVFSAYGSHANYATSGNHIHDDVLVDYCDDGLTWDPILSAYFFHLEPRSFKLTQMSPPRAAAPPTSNLTSFFYFNGRWGDIQYPDDDPRQRTVPTFGIKRYVSGPTGPATKELLRTGLSSEPSHRGWLQWAVAVFMSLYPCCIRGWRVWVFGTLLSGLLMSMVFVVRYGIRRYRRRGYKKVETEIAMDDLAWREDRTSDSIENEMR
ncbi:hypothetical protein CONLIGDRAFT_623853 [Coniochaeta ligniaria NRRL 30616]|uniref:Vacuolar protein sorting-associated protein 62 n=1 Tax=Coniochaeta ligniaria NRRL 30616 TaxID=1408157 RepID=A0A1J7I8G5_9PEZI|nr:hypothetical protein CONLIGDRAFT_623853 [Coniochaeta ligniaria NRRL 30616]